VPVWGSGCTESIRSDALAREHETKKGRASSGGLGTEKGRQRGGLRAAGRGSPGRGQCPEGRGRHAPGGRSHCCSCPAARDSVSGSSKAVRSRIPGTGSWPSVSRAEVGGARVLGNQAARGLLRAETTGAGVAQHPRDQARAAERRAGEFARRRGCLPGRSRSTELSRRHGPGRQRRAACGRRRGFPPARGESACGGAGNLGGGSAATRPGVRSPAAGGGGPGLSVAVHLAGGALCLVPSEPNLRGFGPRAVPSASWAGSEAFPGGASPNSVLSG
jgi:hypothetical protein